MKVENTFFYNHKIIVCFNFFSASVENSKFEVEFTQAK